MTVRIIRGDCLDRLRELPDEGVHCCVTSPPYWGLRDYGVAGQLGLESTPAEYVEKMVAVFREVRRVLRDDGTLWVNMGDSYAAQRGGTSMPAETLAGGVGGKGDEAAHRGRSTTTLGGRQDEANPEIRTFAVAHRNAGAFGLKHKDLVGVPWRLAFALQADGWYLRQDIIWHKPNPMPESVRDRCTKAHEYIFLMAKSERYYYDVEAIAEPAAPASAPRRLRADLRLKEGYRESHFGNPPLRAKEKNNASARSVAEAGGDNLGTRERLRGELEGCAGDFGGGGEGRASSDSDQLTSNKRSVWTIATRPFKEAHFATFPPALIEPCILAGCPVGGTVLDPFGGAGTTGLVADRLQRDAILIELNPDYADIAERRIQGDSPLFAEVA